MHTGTVTVILDDYDIRVNDEGYASYMVQDKTTKIEIFALNLYTLTADYPDESTFTISIESYITEEPKTNIFSIIALVLFILMAIFICVCMICIIRICMNRRRFNHNIELQLNRHEQT